MKVPTFSFSFRKPTETDTAPQVILTPRGWNDELGGYYPTREEMRIQAEAVALYKKLGNKFANAEHERIYRNRRVIDDWKPKNPFEDPNFYNNVIEDEWSTPPQPEWPEDFLETGEPALPGPRLIGETIPWNWVYIFCGMIVWWCLHWTFVYYYDRRIKLYNLGTYRKAFGIPRSDNRPWEVAIAAARQRQKDKENRLRVKAGLHPLWDNPVTGKTEKLEEWDEYGHPIPPLPTKDELAKEEAEWDRWWSKIVRRVEQFDKKGYNLMPGALVDFAQDLYFTEWEEGMVLEDAPEPPEPAPIESVPEPRERSASPKETRSRIEVVKPGQSVRPRLPDPARAPVDQVDAQSTSSKRSKHSASARKTPAPQQPPPSVDEAEAATQRILASIRRKEQQKQREAQNRPQVLGHKINPPRVPPPVADPNVPLWFGMDARRFTHMTDDDGMIIEFQNPWLQTAAEREGPTVKDVEMHDATREKKREAKSAASSKGVKRNRDEFASSTDAAASAKKKSKGLNGLAAPSKEATSKAGRSSRKADESGAEVPPTVEDMTTTQDQEPPEPIEYLEEDGVTSTHPSCRGVKVGHAWAKGEWGFRVGALGQPERLCFSIVRKKPLRPGSFIGPDEEAHLWLTEDEYVRARDHHELPSETHDIIKLGPINPREGLKPRLLATGRRILNDKEILGNGRTDGIRQPKEGEVIKGHPNSERFLSPPRTPEERFMLPLQRQEHRRKQKELAQKERTAHQERKKQEADRLEAEKKEAERVKAEQDEVKRKALAEKEAERRKLLRRIEEKSRTEPLARVEVPWKTLKDMAKMGYEPSGGTVLMRDGVRVDIHGNPYKEDPETKGKEKDRTTPSPAAATTPKQRTVSGSSSTTTTAVESASQSQPSSSPAKTVSFATTPTAVSVSTPPATIKEDKSALLPSPPAPIPALTVTSPTPPRIFRQPAQAPILTPTSPSVQLPQFVPVSTVNSLPFVSQPANNFALPAVTNQVVQPMDVTPTPPSNIQSAHVGGGFNPSAFSAHALPQSNPFVPQSLAMQPTPSVQINPSLFAQSQPAPVATPSLNMFVQAQPNLFAQPPTHAVPFSPLTSSHPTQSAPTSQPFGQGLATSTPFGGQSVSGFGQQISTPSAPGLSHMPMNVEPATGSLSQPFGTSSIGANVGGMQPIHAMPVFTPPVSLPDIYNRPMSKKGAVPRDLRKRPGSNLTHAPAQSSPLAAPQTPETPSHGLVFMEGEGAGSVPSLDNFAHEGKHGTLRAVYGIAAEGQAVGSDVNGSNEEFEEVAGQVPKDLNSYILQDRIYEEIDPCAPKSGSPGPSSITPAPGSTSFPLPGGSTPGTPTMGAFSNFLKSASGQHLVAQYNSDPTAPRLRVGGPLSDATSSQQEIQARPKATNSRLSRGTAPRPNVQTPVVQPTLPTVQTPTTNASTPGFPPLPSQPFMQFAQQQQTGAGPFFAFNPPTGPTLSLANNAFVQGMANTMDRARAEERAAPNQNGAFTFGQ